MPVGRHPGAPTVGHPSVGHCQGRVRHGGPQYAREGDHGRAKGLGPSQACHVGAGRGQRVGGPVVARPQGGPRGHGGQRGHGRRQRGPQQALRLQRRGLQPAEPSAHRPPPPQGFSPSASPGSLPISHNRGRQFTCGLPRRVLFFPPRVLPKGSQTSSFPHGRDHTWRLMPDTERHPRPICSLINDEKLALNTPSQISHAVLLNTAKTQRNDDST